MIPLFFSQNMEAKEPEKKMPSTAAKATTRSLYGASSLPIHFIAQSAFFFTQGIVSMALNRLSLSFGSLMYVSMSLTSLLGTWSEGPNDHSLVAGLKISTLV